MRIKRQKLMPDDAPERLATGATWLEGPTWVGDRLLVSDIPGNRVLSWRPGQTEFDVAIPHAEFTNGRTLTRDGRVYQCSHGRRGVEELHPDLGASSTPGSRASSTASASTRTACSGSPTTTRSRSPIRKGRC
jgi:sugar lactone lactonase YvrE